MIFIQNQLILMDINQYKDIYILKLKLSINIAAKFIVFN